MASRCNAPRGQARIGLCFLLAVGLGCIFHFCVSRRWIQTLYSEYGLNREEFSSSLVSSSSSSSSSNVVSPPPIKVEKTALVMRTVAPIIPRVLEKIYHFAMELHHSNDPYDFWILVDETSHNGSEARIRKFFALFNHDDVNNLVPKVFSISETLVMEHYPKLVSYVYNTPEPNFNNETGLCCDKPIMWQLLAPAFALFMTHPTNHRYRYKFAWNFEDDVSVLGQRTMLELIRDWDQELLLTSLSSRSGDVDLAALIQRNQNPFGPWGWFGGRHTLGFQRILDSMTNASEDWIVVSDTIQRYSQALAEAVSLEVSNNVFQFAEGFLQPVAWSHNLTTVDLSTLAMKNNYSLSIQVDMDEKISRANEIESLLAANDTSLATTALFHEQKDNSIGSVDDDDDDDDDEDQSAASSNDDNDESEAEDSETEIIRAEGSPSPRIIS